VLSQHLPTRANWRGMARQVSSTTRGPRQGARTTRAPLFAGSARAPGLSQSSVSAGGGHSFGSSATASAVTAPSVPCDTSPYVAACAHARRISHRHAAHAVLTGGDKPGLWTRLSTERTTVPRGHRADLGCWGLRGELIGRHCFTKLLQFVRAVTDRRLLSARSCAPAARCARASSLPATQRCRVTRRVWRV
jgi:hypothetical protein